MPLERLIERLEHAATSLRAGELDAERAAATSAERHGGRVLMPPSEIPGVGELVFIADPSGNVTGAMRYLDRA